ncbi:DCC1-like thiol-disulfide oxidoreductase family protein [Kiritimatiellota bacterium B12222]|nr:DCC1-like thiol-disulfide oxidoreductase family protein [Kiritimatiellota bacterium B12222]
MSFEPLVLFDGPCSLCQRSVRFILKHEREKTLSFSSLHSPLGQELLHRHQLPKNLESLVLIDQGKVYPASDGVFQICKYLRYPWRLGYAFRHLPAWMHQPVYHWVARHRYAWFGKDDACPLPDPEQADRFK